MNKKQLAIDAAMPVFFIAVALYVIVKAQGMGSEGIFPTLSGGVLLLSAIYILADTVMKKRQVVNLEGVNLVMVLITVAAYPLHRFTAQNRLHSRHLYPGDFCHPLPGIQENGDHSALFGDCGPGHILCL